MKKATRLLIALSCLLAGTANASTTIPASTLSSAHWTLSGSPYKITGHIIVANGDSLVIDPGVTVEFQGRYKLFCNGKIIANGTPAQRILFTVPAANQSTGWLGIRYDNTPASNGRSYFRYCTVEYGRADITGDNKGGGIFFNNFSNCEIADCTFRNNYAIYGGAICAWGASPTMLRDSFYQNSSDNGGLCIDLQASSATVDSCWFKDAGVYCTNCNVSVTNSTFTKCTWEGGVSAYATNGAAFMTITGNVFDSCAQMSGGGGGAILFLETSGKIEHNIFRNNVSRCAGGAISAWTRNGAANLSNVIISNNLFYNNTAHILPGAGAPFGGGAIAFGNCSGKVINNTIVSNHSDTAGGAVFCGYGSSPSFYNNIIFNSLSDAGSGENIFILDNASDPDFYDNDLEGGYSGINTNGTPLVGANMGTISIMPGFTNPAANDYTLATGSPCIDGGTVTGISGYMPSLDLAGNPRITGSAIDMGAYESAGAIPTAVHGTNAITAPLLTAFPNPATSYFGIKGLAPGELVSVQVLDVLGKELARFDHTAADHMDISKLPAGMFIVHLRCKDESIKELRVLKN